MRKTILIAEDDSDQVTLLQEILSEIDADVIVANDGQETLKKLENNKVDLVILDLSLPLLSGFGVLDKVESNIDTYGEPKVIVYSNYTNEYTNKLIDRKIVSRYLLKLRVEPLDVLKVVKTTLLQ